MTRRLRTAEIVAVGSELTTGAIRDTNAGDLARELTALGVDVRRMSDLPDDLPAVTEAFRTAMERADLVVASGGLGPTPDDLTREAIAAACRLEPRVDADLEAWLRRLFERRRLPMPEANLKQAWLVPGAAALPNERGTAPGWWVDRPDGGVIVALPGPPGELWPMWRDSVLPRLAENGIGTDRAERTLRLTGVGESMLVGLIGDDVLRRDNPRVATYARPDAVDVRVTAVSADGVAATELVDRTVEELRPRVGRYVFAENGEGWPHALSRALGRRRLATLEIGTAGELLALLGNAECLQFGQLLRSGAAAEHAAQNLTLYAERVREMSGADVGLAVHAAERDGDMRVLVAVATPDGTVSQERTAFLTGEQGRRRAALAACAVLRETLRSGADE